MPLPHLGWLFSISLQLSYVTISLLIVDGICQEQIGRRFAALQEHGWVNETADPAWTLFERPCL